jgi:hypothetical protein
MRDARYHRIVFNQYGQLSLMVLTTAIDCRNLLSGCRDTTAGRRFLAAVFVQVPSPPRHRVLGFRYMQSRTRAHRTPTCDFLRLPFLSLDDLRAVTLLSPHLDIHTLSTDGHFHDITFLQ